MTSVVVRGLPLEVDEEAIFDIKNMHKLAQLDSGEGVPDIWGILVAFFGAEQAETIYKAGFTRPDTAAEFFAEAITAANAKNSLTSSSSGQ